MVYPFSESHRDGISPFTAKRYTHKNSKVRLDIGNEKDWSIGL